jgi:hypothetical protein
VEEPRLLADILESRRNPVLQTYETLISPLTAHLADHQFKRLLEGTRDMTIRSVEQYEGDLKIFEACSWDWPTIRRFFLSLSRGKPSTALKRLKASFDQASEQRTQPVDKYDTLERIRRELS